MLPGELKARAPLNRMMDTEFDNSDMMSFVNAYLSIHESDLASENYKVIYDDNMKLIERKKNIDIDSYLEDAGDNMLRFTCWIRDTRNIQDRLYEGMSPRVKTIWDGRELVGG